MYQAQLKPWWMLQPDLQYVINPGGGVLNSDGSLRRNGGHRRSLIYQFLNEPRRVARDCRAYSGRMTSAASIT
jgi:hypothetical protein